MTWVTVYGVVAVTFMMVMYMLEGRSPVYVALFALGCALSSSYGFCPAPGRSASSRASGASWRCSGSSGPDES
jgi:hypothetical protein